MYANLTIHDDDATLDVTAVHDKYTPGVRFAFGPMYLSLTVAETVDLVDGLAGALAELDQRVAAPELVRDCEQVDADVAAREGL